MNKEEHKEKILKIKTRKKVSTTIPEADTTLIYATMNLKKRNVTSKSTSNCLKDYYYFKKLYK